MALILFVHVQIIFNQLSMHRVVRNELVLVLNRDFLFHIYSGSVTPSQGTCTKMCANGGVCNVVNGQEVCWCQLGFSGSNCEVQGIVGRCYQGLCLAGSCYEQTIGASTYAYCQCTPGYTGITCNQCSYSILFVVVIIEIKYFFFFKFRLFHMLSSRCFS